MKVIQPSESIPEPFNTERTPIHFTDASTSTDNYSIHLNEFKVPIFTVENDDFVLVKDLALLLNYPSSYHLIAKVVKNSTITKPDFIKSTPSLNTQLLGAHLVEDASVSYFYIELKKIYNAISNKEILISSPNYENDTETNLEKLTVSQVFPAYGFVNNAIELKHSTFNCLTNLSKYNYYKSIENFHHLPMSKLTPTELENLYNINDYSKLEVNKPEIIVQNIKRRKPIGKTRKNATNIDPNTLELKDTVIPGQGYIQEFNINHVCRVPTYYVTNSTASVPNSATSSSVPVSASSTQTEKLNTQFLNVQKPKDVKISRYVSQLTINNEYESFNFNKYFYIKAYRGPGSGNYKDASLVNRINKIPSTDKVFKKNHTSSIQKRHKIHLKGLTHEKFNRHYVDYILKQTSEDPENMEMLHNTLQFNVLMNTYRDISFDTWSNYFTFKQTDFEVYTEKKHVDVNDKDAGAPGYPPRQPTFGPKYLLDKFNLPQDYKEIVRKLPAELRPEIRKPLYFNMKTSETANSEMLTNIDVIKLPNANSIGWDNLKKYHDQ